jgi:hypothetical protein
MTSRRPSRAAQRTARTTRPTGHPRQRPPVPNSTGDRTLNAILAFMNKLPKPYRGIPQPWHFLIKLATVIALGYLFWGVITAVVNALLSVLLLLAIAVFGFAMIVGMFKYSVSDEGRREEERWYEDNDPRGNGPRGAL